MGSLARHGICNGCRVDLNVLLPQVRTKECSQLYRKYFAKLGIARIAERVTERRPLSVADIDLLINKAAFAALLKLVELRCGAEVCLRPKPLTLLPFKRWFNQHSSEQVLALAQQQITQYQQPDLRVAIDPSEVEGCDSVVRQDILRVINETVARYPTVTFVEPNGEVLDLALLKGTAKRPDCIDASRTTIVSSNILDFASSQDLSHELFRIHEQSVEKGVDLWIPMYHVVGSKGRCVPPAIKDFQLLKLLALGSITLMQVKYRRASTKFFSMSALSLARLCGANDLGFGAVDKSTAKTLKIAEIQALQFIAANDSIDQVAASKSVKSNNWPSNQLNEIIDPYGTFD